MASKRYRPLLLLISLLLVLAIALAFGALLQNNDISSCEAEGLSPQRCEQIHRDPGRVWTEAVIALVVFGPLVVGRLYDDEIDRVYARVLKPPTSARQEVALRAAGWLIMPGIVLLITGVVGWGAANDANDGRLSTIFAVVTVIGGLATAGFMGLVVLVQVLSRRSTH